MCRKMSRKGTTTTAGQTRRARRADGSFVKTHTLTADLMTQVSSLEPREKITCAEVRNVRKFGVVCTLRGLFLLVLLQNSCPSRERHM